jgi:pimeloyl-ACP methyl ester carboxylesterase
MRRALVVCLAAGLLAACGSGGSGGAGAAATSSAETAEPIAGCIEPQDPDLTGVHLQPKPGVRLDAVVLGTGSTGIVFSNMSSGDLCSWLPTGLVYARQRYRVALYDYSGGQDADADLRDVAAELRRRGATRIALVGASMGGTTSMVAAEAVHAVAVFVLSAPDVFDGLDALGAAAHVTAPSWFGVGEDDTQFVQSAKDLYAHSAARRKTLKILPSGAHGTELLGASVDTMLTNFLHANAPAG